MAFYEKAFERLDEKLEKGASILFDDDPLANMLSRGLGRGATALGKAAKARLKKLRGKSDEEMSESSAPERDYVSDVGSAGGAQDWGWLKDILSNIASDISSIKQTLIEQTKEQADSAEAQRLQLMENQLESNGRSRPVPEKSKEETKSGGSLGLLGLLGSALGGITSFVDSIANGAIGGAIKGGVSGLGTLAASIITEMPLATVVALVGGAFWAWWKFGGGEEQAKKSWYGDNSMVEDPKQGKIFVGPKPEDKTVIGDLVATGKLVQNKFGIPFAENDDEIKKITEGINLRELRKRMADNIKSGSGADNNYWSRGGWFSDARLSDQARSKIFGQMDTFIGEPLRQGDLTRARMKAEGNRSSADLTKNEAKIQGEIVTEGLTKIVKENMSNLQKEYDKLTKESPFNYDERNALLKELTEQEKLINTLQNYNEQLKNPENDLSETIKKINSSLDDFEKKISGGLYGGFGDYGRGSRQINIGKEFADESTISNDKKQFKLPTGNLDTEATQRVLEISQNLGIKPEWLMSAMDFETGGTFSPNIKNRAGSGATGLIQFMPSTARRLGTSTEALSKMSQIDQLGYVEKYLKPFAGKINSPEDMYMSILYPKAVGKTNDYVLFDRGTKEYQQNSGLDKNNDGIVNKKEAAVGMVARLTKYAAQPIPKSMPDLQNPYQGNNSTTVVAMPTQQQGSPGSMQLAMAGLGEQKQSAVSCVIDGSVRAACK